MDFAQQGYDMEILSYMMSDSAPQRSIVCGAL